MRLHRRCALAASLAAAALGAACGVRVPVRQPDGAALRLLTQRLDASLNEPAVKLQHRLAAAARDRRVYGEEITQAGRGETLLLDWWIYEKGLIRFAGKVSFRRGYFVLTPRGEAFVTAPPPRWLTSTLKGAPSVSCAGGSRMATCNVEAVAAVTVTPEAADLLSGVKVPDQAFRATLVRTAAGWRAEDLVLLRGPASDVAQTAIFGDRRAMNRARFAFAQRMNRLAR